LIKNRHLLPADQSEGRRSEGSTKLSIRLWLIPRLGTADQKAELGFFLMFILAKRLCDGFGYAEALGSRTMA